MNLGALLSFLENNTDFQGLLSDLEASIHVRSVALVAARPYLLAALSLKMEGPLVVVTPRAERAQHLQEQLSLWLGTEDSIYLFPELELSPDLEVVLEPTGGLERLRLLARLDAGEALPKVIVAAVAAMAQPLPSPASYREQRLTLAVGDRINLEELLAKLVAWGYEPSPAVEAPGGFARRGGILDVFPPQETRPFRIELFGNRVDSLRAFDPMSQRSLTQIPSAAIGPARAQQGEASLLAYLSPGCLLVVEDPEETEAVLEVIYRTMVRRLNEKIPPDPPLQRGV